MSSELQAAAPVVELHSRTVASSLALAATRSFGRLGTASPRRSRSGCGSLPPVTSPARSSVVEWAWQRQSVWSQAADRLKTGPSRARRFLLTLTVAGAAVALTGNQLKPINVSASVVLAALAAVMLAAVGFLRARQSVEQVRRWTRARSVSEALKSEAFLFLTGVGDYAGPDAAQRLDAEVQRLEREAGDLQRWTNGLPPSNRPLPAVHDLETYLALRVRRSQLAGYYEPKARQLPTRLRTAKVIEVTLALIAAGLAALNTVSPNVGAWAAVATTAAGALAAHVAGERYEFLWIEYSRTASELLRLAERRTAPDGRPLSDPELIAACEQVISVQNQGWMAKWGEDDTASRAERQ